MTICNVLQNNTMLCVVTKNILKRLVTLDGEASYIIEKKKYINFLIIIIYVSMFELIYIVIYQPKQKNFFF